MERNMKPVVKSSGRCTVVPVLATVAAIIHRKATKGMVHPADKADKLQQMKIFTLRRSLLWHGEI